MYDVLIVGSGLFGAVFARQCLNAGKTVLVIERREHIAGNCFTQNVAGIEQHVYGPHIFHTNSDKIWDYVQQFGRFNHFMFRPKVNYHDKLYSFPINLFTLYQLFRVKTPEEARVRLESARRKIDNPQNLEEWVLSQVGPLIYQMFIRGYTTKQWMRDPKELPADIIKRLPVRLSFDDNYFTDRYQGIPEQGYTAIIRAMLDGATIALETDYLADRDAWDARAKTVVFTGCIDEFYARRYGALDYRSLRFEAQRHELPDYQGTAVINYTDATVPYTRVIEHKHFSPVNTPHTLVTHEFPATYGAENPTPYYPINDKKNSALHTQYAALAKQESKYIFGGRLAEYRYYDMHQVIGSALVSAARFLGESDDQV